ncbi:hypothetical protein ATX68_09950 [Oenococcus oeni]|nr:hypothetical protein ATW70_10145 [Oenococcus oeni]OIL91656.1 hypothetical protein ATX43_09720 [Oenococcus oeni]OIM41479.1 hypothetical protein ATX68_09950 [Oenococcus oeni]
MRQPQPQGEQISQRHVIGVAPEVGDIPGHVAGGELVGLRQYPVRIVVNGVGHHVQHDHLGNQHRQ